MKFSVQWLREWVNPELTTSALAQQLTMAGLEVEGIHPVAADFEQVVIGEVKTVAPHPDADKLRVCQVDVGLLQLPIVCGAANVAAGQKVAVALVGAHLPGLKIKAAKLRGVLSQGMICSLSELGLAESAEGIWVLPADAPVGQAIRTWLDLDDQQLELSVTPNRGDALSIAGIAREVAALNGLDIQAVSCAPVPAQLSQQVQVHVTAAEACPRYVGRIIQGINPQAQSPLWLVERLRRSGIRSINALVDITNYVLLELGQPLHAFDLNEIQGDITVRFAHPQEPLTLLNNQTVALAPNTLVIADNQQALAIAGVMGGLASAVTATTTAVFLESAFFQPLALAGVARQYGLQTDSAFRFERGVDPELCLAAMERATALIISIAGGQPGPLCLATAPQHLPLPATILVRRQRIQRVLGITIADTAVEDILQRLGMSVVKHPEGWEVKAPSYRFDINLEVDVIEELARIYGYQQIPSQQPQALTKLAIEAERILPPQRFKQLLVARGYQEAICYSFVAPQLQQALTPEQPGLRLVNPISSELAVMRTTLWSGLLPAIRHNLHRQQARVRLFETGLQFIQQAGNLVQQPMLAAAITGQLYPEQWGIKAKAVDFFDVKADVEALLQLTAATDFEFKPAQHPALHPGQTAAIYRQHQCLGYLGQLHPQLAQQFDIGQAVYLFELQLAALEFNLPRFQAISKFPAVKRDLALLVPQHVSAQQLVQCAKLAAGSLLVNLELFDVYQGKGIAASQKSIALRLTWQHPQRTLVDNEIQAVVQAVVTALAQECQAVLRDS